MTTATAVTALRISKNDRNDEHCPCQKNGVKSEECRFYAWVSLWCFVLWALNMLCTGTY